MTQSDAVLPSNPGKPADERRLRARVAWAGFFGVIPFGVGLCVPVLSVLEVRGIGRIQFRDVLMVPICLLPLTPFVVAMRRVDRRGWLRVLKVIVPGLMVGAGSVFLGYLIGLVLIPAGVLGLIYGIRLIRPCRSRNDATGVALALLGTAPALLFLILWSAEWLLRRR